jgi:glycosyltransferase involved in cell wall biosynthesis
VTGAPGVLHVVLSLGTGGTERLVIQLCTLLQNRFRVSVCCLDDRGSRAGELIDRGCDVVALHRRPGFHPSLGYRIAQLAVDRRADILHCHHYSPFVYGRIAAAINRRLKIVFTEHGRLSDDPPSLKRRVVNPVLGRLAGSLHSVSDALRQSMTAEGFPGRRIDVIHNGIEPGPRPTASDRWRARQLLGMTPGDLVIGTAARLDPVKNLDALIEAHTQVRRLLKRGQLVIIGDGSERRRLEACAYRAGVADSVRFCGDRDDVRLLLPAFDVYVNCSISEGISLTILEAMAAALPIVATRVGGTPEIVTGGLTGTLVPPRDTGALVSAILDTCMLPDGGRMLGSAGRSRVEHRFTIDRMVQRYASIYSTVAAN